MLTHRSLVKSLTEGHRSRMAKNKYLSFVCELNEHSCSLTNLKHTHAFIPQTGSLEIKTFIINEFKRNSGSSNKIVTLM